MIEPGADGSKEARNLLYDVLKLPEAREWTMERDPYGKPYFPEHPEIHFNMSHTKGCVCCALADQPVGVDVELQRPMKHRDQVVERFSEEEHRLWEQTSKEQRERLFFQLWVLKESYVKADGRGLRIPLSSFTVLPKLRVGDYHLHLYDIADQPYIVAACSQDTEFAPSVAILE